MKFSCWNKTYRQKPTNQQANQPNEEKRISASHSIFIVTMKLKDYFFQTQRWHLTEKIYHLMFVLGRCFLNCK